MSSDSGPYFDPDFDPLVERAILPGVVIDNDAREDCTLVEVDSVNRDGILLEMVQLFTDLDLLISKSYISSDGSWLMDVFHVTDQLGRKIAEPSLPQFIQQALVPARLPAETLVPKLTTCLGNVVGPRGPEASECAALEFAVPDRLGILSEIAAVLVDLGCHVASGQAWTHNGRAAGVLYVTADAAVPEPSRWSRIEELVDGVVRAHGVAPGERHRVRVSAPGEGRVHTERRLHQLMRDDRDYEAGPAPMPVDEEQFGAADAAREGRAGCGDMETRVSIESWEERGYAVVKMTSRDRPRLLFDTVCALTDMQYVVFHAAVGSRGPLAIQEYYIRHKDGRALDYEGERLKVARCLVAAVERRVSHGLRLDVHGTDRSGLLSDITRALRENSLSLARIDLVKHGDEAAGTFYVNNASGGVVDAKTVEAVRTEVGKACISVEVIKDTPGWPLLRKTVLTPTATTSLAVQGLELQQRPRFNLGSLLWSHFEKLSTNFGHIRF